MTTFIPDTDVDWMRDAVCASTDPELFFPEQANTAGPAVQICRGCPVAAQCLAFAQQHHLTGVWGGLTDRQRQALRPKVRRVGGHPSPVHGTPNGYRAHHRTWRTPLCDPCREAERVRKRELRKAS